MTTGMLLLDKLLAVAAFVFLLYWIYSLTARPREKRIERKKD